MVFHRKVLKHYFTMYCIILGEPNDRELTLKSILDTYNPAIFTKESNLINSNVSIQIGSDFYNSTLLIHNQLGQLVKTIDTTTDNHILTDASNLTNGMYFITSSIKNYVNPIKFLKVN